LSESPGRAEALRTGNWRCQDVNCSSPAAFGASVFSLVFVDGEEGAALSVSASAVPDDDEGEDASPVSGPASVSASSVADDDNDDDDAVPLSSSTAGCGREPAARPMEDTSSGTVVSFLFPCSPSKGPPVLSIFLATSGGGCCRAFYDSLTSRLCTPGGNFSTRCLLALQTCTRLSSAALHITQGSFRFQLKSLTLLV